MWRRFSPLLSLLLVSTATVACALNPVSVAAEASLEMRVESRIFRDGQEQPESSGSPAPGMTAIARDDPGHGRQHQPASHKEGLKGQQDHGVSSAAAGDARRETILRSSRR